MSEAFRRDFLITHFFNPPRYMRLLEIVAGPDTAPDTVAAVAEFADVALGKSVVRCEDSPGFIANRLGIYWMQLALIEAIDQGLTVEEADAIIGRPMGIPKTGVFGLMDLVGIDLGPHVNASMRAVLPKSDAFHSVDRDMPLIARMIEQGLTGRKGKGGFYRLDRSGGGRVKLAIDLNSGRVSAGTAARTAGDRGGRAGSAGAAVGTRQGRHLCIPCPGADHRLRRDVGPGGGRLDCRHR